MQIDIDKEVALLQRMTVGQLREKFEETWGEPTNTRNKQWLIKRIAWKMQANIEGDISQRARRRAAELARGTDIRTTAPKAIKPTPKLAGDTVTGIRSARGRQSSTTAEIRDRTCLQRREDRGARSGERLRIRGSHLQDA